MGAMLLPMLVLMLLLLLLLIVEDEEEEEGEEVALVSVGGGGGGGGGEKGRHDGRVGHFPRDIDIKRASHEGKRHCVHTHLFEEHGPSTLYTCDCRAGVGR